MFLMPTWNGWTRSCRWAAVLSLSPITDRLRQSLHRVFKTPAETVRLMSASDEALRPIAQALGAAWRRSPSGDERVWFGKIEALRRRLEQSTAELTIVDYGAGSADQNLTPQEMQQGKTVRRRVADICRTAAKPRDWATLLFYLVRHVRPGACLELGSSLGISAAYQSAALELNGHGRLVTVEGAEPVATLARRHLTELGLARGRVEVGRFQDRLDDVLRDLGRLDFAFIDGHHDERATIAYFEKVLPACAERAVLVFDDIAWSPGMRRAWAGIAAHERVGAAIDLFKIGIGVIAPLHAPKQRFKIAFA